MDEKLRVGILGVGTFATAMHVPVLKATGRATIAAVCRRNERLLAMAKEHIGAEEAYTDWREMLDKAKLDAVVVCTPHDLHCEQTIAALDRGLHVLVEKPMALTAEDGWAMVAAAERADRVLMVAYDNRMGATQRTIKAVLDQGRVGRIRQVTVTTASYYNWFFTSGIIPENLLTMGFEMSGLPAEFYNNGHILENYWRSTTQQTGGGLFVDRGSHGIDLALWFGGAPATEVVAFMDATAPEIERFVAMQARLENGVLVSFSSSDINEDVQQYAPMNIVGEDGVLMRDSMGIRIQTARGVEEIEAQGPDLYSPFAFVSCILDGTPNPIPGEAGAHAAALMEAAYLSAAEGRIVSVASPS
ncbi:MAG: Gfo/Idh/MocA family oxidoreductase [Anaerolineae bacterium]|nr:Gfo/Idh/MocA family oxidoreductase [Anaerolineae bacterium]